MPPGSAAADAGRARAVALVTGAMFDTSMKSLAVRVLGEFAVDAALRELLRAYATGGQTATALSAYAAARERLAEDLGTDPSPETAGLYTAILRGELPAIAPARGTTTTTGLVGRADELAFLDACAARLRGTATSEVVVVDGEAGMGKTSLLRAWAGQRAAADDAVLLAACGQLDRSMPLDAVLTSLAGLLRRAGDGRYDECRPAHLEAMHRRIAGSPEASS
jgi:hypothetical protein